MSSRVPAVLLVGLLTLGLAVACTDSQAGVATQDPNSTATEEPDPSSSDSPSNGDVQPTVEIPPRPRELPLDGVDPCTLFTEAQLAQIEVTSTRPEVSKSGKWKGMKECVLDVIQEEPFFIYNYDVMAATNEGIENWLTGDRNVEAELTEVGGFAAANFWFRGEEGNKTTGCATAVDVAEGQNLEVEALNDTDQTMTLRQLCQLAEEAAGLALQTLQTLK